MQALDSKIITFIITDREDREFTSTIFRANNIIDYGNGVVVHEAKSMITLLQGFHSDFQFRLIIHIGYVQGSKDWRAQNTITALKEYLDTTKLVYISREFEAFAGDATHNEINGFTVWNANKINQKAFIDALTVFKKGDLIGESIEVGIPIVKKDEAITHPTFMIQAALSEHEFDAFRKEMHEIENVTPSFLQGSFRKLEKRQFEDDYDQKFWLVRQRQMGMVDAAIDASVNLSTYKPDFLILAGVCAGRESKGVARYDVIIPKRTHDLVTGKYSDSEFRPYGYSERFDEDLITYLNDASIKERIRSGMLMLCDPEKKKLRARIPELNFHMEDTACVPWVEKRDSYLEDVAQTQADKIYGLEMEGYSIARSRNIVSSKNGKYALMIKSVMDFANSDKKDSHEGENYKENAAYISYLCVRSIIPILCEYYRKHC